MGLAIGVGITADQHDDPDDDQDDDQDDDPEYAEDARRLLTGLSTALAAEGVEWTEPTGAPVPDRRVDGSFPYSFLHTLRRVYALIDEGEPVTPREGPGITAADDALIQDASLMFSSHLLCHSDCEGYYVPVPFDDPLFVDESLAAGGGMVGSSHTLLDELRALAPAIGVRLEPDGSLSDAEAGRLAALPESDPWEIESLVWVTLHEACRASIASGCAIVFS